ncbi:hypothetical protein [Sphingomicrobium sediminis]|uniref:PepSY domain-containing protein n=1 Tax=Sphingomicrobium sediminis TaxID=2950949 RepID=A0A9X2EHI8_9SPHN|nr:hypothetical protein [Sphingomicrobium sediminis]MCM8557616.1 hypothetical protein [Sphingomicrobium sediminis]
MKTVATRTLALGAIALVAVPAPAIADPARQLVDINGMYAGPGERALRDRGFAFVSHERNSRGYDYSYWWDEDDDDCVRVEEYDGRVQSISDASDQDCGHHLSSGVETALGVAAGAAILGAIFGSKGHDDDRDENQRNSDREYDRGYTDGLHNASYHNRRGTDEYASGYRAGVTQRNANLRHHDRRGGYSDYADWRDLVGARATAIDQLNNRGFEQVDNFVSGNARYSIWWREGSRQCLQVITADGRLENITDIRTHPRCR